MAKVDFIQDETIMSPRQTSEKAEYETHIQRYTASLPSACSSVSLSRPSNDYTQASLSHPTDGLLGTGLTNQTLEQTEFLSFVVYCAEQLYFLLDPPAGLLVSTVTQNLPAGFQQNWLEQ